MNSAAEKSEIKAVLERLYKKYNHREFVPPDPLQFLYNYSRPTDVELVGLLASCLAYGRVEQIQKSLTKLFGYMGKSPAEFVKNFSPKDRQLLKDFKHRFNTGEDIADLFCKYDYYSIDTHLLHLYQDGNNS